MLPACLLPSQCFAATKPLQRLLSRLEQDPEVLHATRCQPVYLDGSLVTPKDEPGDFDACWDVMGVAVERRDPALFDFSNGRAAHEARFGGELFQARLPNRPNGTTFLDIFQIDKQTGFPRASSL